jgi:hypothetical protein
MPVIPAFGRLRGLWFSLGYMVRSPSATAEFRGCVGSQFAIVSTSPCYFTLSFPSPSGNLPDSRGLVEVLSEWALRSCSSRFKPALSHSLAMQP